MPNSLESMVVCDGFLDNRTYTLTSGDRDLGMESDGHFTCPALLPSKKIMKMIENPFTSKIYSFCLVSFI
jgi:hypothetical protein